MYLLKLTRTGNNFIKDDAKLRGILGSHGKIKGAMRCMVTSVGGVIYPLPLRLGHTHDDVDFTCESAASGQSNPRRQRILHQPQVVLGAEFAPHASQGTRLFFALILLLLLLLELQEIKHYVETLCR